MSQPLTHAQQMGLIGIGMNVAGGLLAAGLTQECVERLSMDPTALRMIYAAACHPAGGTVEAFGVLLRQLVDLSEQVAP